VYLWWERLAGEQGLSVVGTRPGVPALALVLQGALGRTPVSATAALQVSLAVAAGLASAALVRRVGSRTAWVLSGLLAGTFAVHLAAGYLANLLQVCTFLVAATALGRGTRRAAFVSAGLLAAGGLAHALFFLLGTAILLGTAALAWRRDRAEAVRVGAAAIGSVGIVGAGLLSLLPGPPPRAVDTSKDAFLRRAGLAGELRGAYLDRFVHRAARYVQWATVPLAVAGLRAADGFVLRFLATWGLATVAGVAASLVTGWLPADRFVTFGFAVPILAALGVEWLTRRLSGRRVVATAVGAGLTVAMLAGAFVAWNRQEPFLSEDEVETATAAGAIATGLDVGVPLAFLVNEPDTDVSFLATRAGNVIRAAMPPDRIRDVIVVVPPLTDGRPSDQRRALELLTAADLRSAEDHAGRPAATFVLTPFDAVDEPEGAHVIAPDTQGWGTRGFERLEASSGGGIAMSAVLVMALLGVAGLGWALLVVDDVLDALLLAPAGGAAALVIAAIALERLGVSIDGAVGAWLVSAIAGGSGFAIRFVVQRRASRAPVAEVE
jgi:hypothetical protein